MVGVDVQPKQMPPPENDPTVWGERRLAKLLGRLSVPPFPERRSRRVWNQNAVNVDARTQHWSKHGGTTC